MISLRLRNYATVLVALIALAGCREQSPFKDIQPPAAQNSFRSIAAVRWVGAGRAKSDTNSSELCKIAAMPESVALFEQTLQKLAHSPWNLRQVTVDTNTASTLQSVLRHGVTDGFFFELAALGKGQFAGAFAVPTTQDEARRYRTNLAIVAESLTGNRVSLLSGEDSGWISQPANWAVRDTGTSPRETTSRTCMAFVETGQWVVLGFAPDAASFLQIANRLAENGMNAKADMGGWLKVTIDLAELAEYSAVLRQLFSFPPAAELHLTGDGGRVHTELIFTFPKPLDLRLSQWNVPTNLVEQPSASFAALRDLDQLLSGSEWWRRLRLNPTPEQVYVWSLAGEARFTFFAAATSNPTNFVNRVADILVPQGKAWKTENTLAGFQLSPTYHGVEWNGMPFLWPFLRTTHRGEGSFVLGGAFVHTPVTEPLSPRFYEEALGAENLLFYGWEHSGQRVSHWLFIGQFARLVSTKAQLPSQCRSVLWLKALESRLGDAVTRVHVLRPDQLRLTRSSSVGLTAFELHLLADWLESPVFPFGAYTLYGEPETLVRQD